MSHSYLFTSESVTEGHPDKLADQLSDAVLDAMLTADPNSRVACESLVTTGLVIVAGEITCDAWVDIPSVVRKTVTEVGYTDAKFGLDGETCGVLTAIQDQSPDIARGVEDATEHREGHSQDALDHLGAGDQGMMFGFACRETEELMPLPIAMAHRLARRLADVRRAGVVPYLRPDGKAMVTIAYEGHTPVRVDTVLISAQHREEVDVETLLKPDIVAEVVDPVLREFTEIDATAAKVIVNPTGRFEIGGPKADTGLTGRKIIVDTYGGMAPHGGGAFSGKDPTKVDRSAAYMARYVAKNVVAVRARRSLPAPGGVRDRHRPSRVADGRDVRHGARPTPTRSERRSASCSTSGPAAIIRDLAARRPIYRETAAYGHFGRKEFPWEATDRVDDLRRAVG